VTVDSPGLWNRHDFATASARGAGKGGHPRLWTVTTSGRVLRAKPEAGSDPEGSDPARPNQPWIEMISGMMRIATMLAILIIGLIAGPAVSL
jgi:hypothetical protein